MRLRQFECFRALMMHGTMTRAAELLGMSQPGVSTTIAALEHAVGLQLFVRRGSRLQPTPEARLLYEQAERVLESVDNTLRVANEIKAGRRGSISIVAYPNISVSFLPRAMAAFCKGRSELKIRIITRQAQAVKELISTQAFDFAITELPTDYPASHTDVFSYDCFCMLPLDHALADHEYITPVELDGVPFVTVFRGDPIYQKVAAAFAAYGARWNVVAETEFLLTSCELVAAGQGVGIIDPVVSSPYLDRVRTVPFKPVIDYQIGILYPLHEEISLISLEFIDFIKSRLGSPSCPAISKGAVSAKLP